MARSGSIRGGGLPPQPPSPQRTLYLGRAARHFDALAGDLGSAMSASSLTEARLRNHWSTHVRPPDHPWLARTEEAVTMAAKGKWDRVMGELWPFELYLAMYMPDDLNEARRTTPALLSKYIGQRVWEAMTQRNDFLDLQGFFSVAYLMYPDLPDDWLLPTGAAIALTADTTLRLHPQWRRSGARLQHEEQQFLQAMTESLGLLHPSLDEQLPAIPADYFPALVHEWRQLIFAALGRVVLAPDALTDAHLADLFSNPIIPGALWMLAGYFQPESRQYWYREIQQQIRDKLVYTAPSLLQQGLLTTGAALAEAQGATLDVQWYAARTRGIVPFSWTTGVSDVVLQALGRIGAAFATSQSSFQLLQTTAPDFDQLVNLPIPDDNEAFMGAILLARLFQLHVVGRVVVKDSDANELAAVDQLWDNMMRSAQSNVRDNLPPEFALIGTAPLASAMLATIILQIAYATIREPAAQAIVITELRAFFQHRGLDRLVESLGEVLDALSALNV